MNEEMVKARQLMEDGWRARESLEFDKAQKLLNEAMNIFERNEDWYNVTECLNHLAYTEKLKAKQNLAEGLDLANKARDIADKYNTKKGSVLRALMSLRDAQSNYELAEIIAEKLLAETSKPANKADILSHLAIFKLRTGKPDEAQEAIEEAHKLLSSVWEKEGDPVRSIWLCKILLTKSLISYNRQNVSEAERLAKEALAIATEKNLKTRIEDAKQILGLIEKNGNIL